MRKPIQGLLDAVRTVLAVIDRVVDAIEAALRWLFCAIGWLICYALAAITLALVVGWILCLGLWILAPLWMPWVPGGVDATPYLLVAGLGPFVVWLAVGLVRCGISALRDALRRWGVWR